MKNFSITLYTVLALLYSFSLFSQDCFDSAIGGFENSGWTPNAGDFTMDPNYVYEGNWGLTNPTGNTIHSSPIAVTGGGTIFQLSWWYWSPHNLPETATARISWYDSSGLLISSSTQNYGVSSYYAWENEVLYFQSPANAAYALISYRNTSNNIIYFDSNCLSHYVPEDCLDPDNGFEYGTDYNFSGGAGISTAVVYEGISSLRLPNGGRATTANIPVNGGSDYELSYYHRSQTHANAPNTIEVTFTWFDAANTQISQNSNSHNRSYRFWSNVNLNYTAPANATSLRISYYSTYPHPVYFDNSCLSEILPPQISISDANADEGDPMTFTVSVSEQQPVVIDVNIAYTDVTATNADYTASVYSVQLPANSDSVTFNVATIEDTIYEINETFNATISTSTAGITVDDGTGVGTITDDEEYIGSATIDFDGVDDYIATSSEVISGLTDMTMMGWIKIDPTFTGAVQSVMMGQDNLEINIDNFGTPALQVRFGGAAINTVQFDTDGVSPILELGTWVHVAVVYNGSASTSIVYINGEERSRNSVVSPSLNVNADPFTIGKRANNNSNYFKGNIDEVRVFDTNLTEDQIQLMVYQEITQVGTDVGGAVIPKVIKDFSTNATIPWSNLIAYYPMTDVNAGKTNDASGNGRDIFLYNITTIQPQTAPMPYETKAANTWQNTNTWLHGDVWDITNIADNKDWSIVHIKHDVNTTKSHTNAGLIIDSGVTLKVDGTNEINNTLYLEINGELDLQDDSQLIQGINSDLVTSAQGFIKRRQEGTTNIFWYNYWSSPVGAINATTLSNNNATSNNANNTSYALNLLKQGDGNTPLFTTALNPPLTNPVSLSSRWFYGFLNGLTYFDWIELDENTAIVPGMGYAHKGTGNPNFEQQYIFEGKPNNGTILIAGNDVDGDAGNESQDDVTLTTTLIGNPYPSALDARQFIADNAGVIEGTILLWEQWAGTSHYLAEYEGGYGMINNMTTLRAYQHADIPIAGQTQTQGIKTPTPFLPVAQGFFVEVIEDGNIEFNNAQRVFKKEADGESVFFDPETTDSDKPSDVETTNSNRTVDNPNNMELIRFEFATSEGATRRFVTGFSDFTTDGFDYGYDGGLVTIAKMPDEDMGIYVDNKQYALQAFAPITSGKVIDLAFNGSGDVSYSLEIVDIQNIDDSKEIYLRDNQENILWDLRDRPYSFSANPGQDNERFDIVFKDKTPEDIIEEPINDILIYANNTQNKLFVKGLDNDSQLLTFTNILGQNIKSYRDLSVNTLENGIDTSSLAKGVYIINLITNDDEQVTKKIIL